MPRKRLTDAFLRSLKPAPKGRRVDWMDEVAPGMGVRVTDKGQATFIYIARYPGSPNPARRALGEFGAVPMRADERPVTELAAAREKAREWRRLIAQDIDPREREEQRQEAERRRRDTTFEAVVEDYLRARVRKQRRGAKAEQEIRNYLITAWGRKPVTAITRADVISLVERIAERAPYQAHAAFGHARTFFNWAINRELYGLDASPCDRVKAAQLIGAKKPRQRVLTDDELRAFWRASGRLGYPFGPMFRLLLLTGQRRAEIAEAKWPEFSPQLVRLVRERKPGEAIDWRRVPEAAKTWTVPPERFKSDSSHLVPLTDAACAILAELPQFKSGPHLFSTTAGRKPVSGFSKAKARLDARMERTLKALARQRGEDPSAVKLEPFVNHDLRRSMRTRLAALRIRDEVAEMVVGHGRKGIQRVYDLHHYEPEMREALEAWAGKLRDIVEPPPENVVRLAVTA